jgi:hypothetical protein
MILLITLAFIFAGSAGLFGLAFYLALLIVTKIPGCDKSAFEMLDSVNKGFKSLCPEHKTKKNKPKSKSKS